MPAPSSAVSAALLMQSSGVGNCVNMFSLIKNCGLPCLVLVTMRGEWEEFNPWQIPMGSITEECLRLSGFSTYRIDDPARVDEIVGLAADRAFGESAAIASDPLANPHRQEKDWR